MTIPIDGTSHPAPVPGMRPLSPMAPHLVPAPAVSTDQLSISPLAATPSREQHLAEEGVHPASQKALASLPGARTWVGKLPGNGGREVALIVPPGVDLTKPVTMVTYFHGWYQNLGKNLLTDRPGAPSLREALLNDARHQNAVFVVPMGSPPHVAHAGKQNQTWMLKDAKSPETNLRTLQDQSLNLLKAKWGRPSSNIQVKEWVLAGHSGGGHAMNNALKNYTPLDSDAPHVNQLWYLDATYERPPLLPGVTVKAIYRPRFKPGVMDTQTQAEALKNQPGVQLTRVSHSHDDIARLGLRHLLNPPAGHLKTR